MNYFIVGNGDYARMMNRYLRDTTDIVPQGFVVPKECIKEETLDGIAVYDPGTFFTMQKPADCRLFMGVGYRNMNSIKEKEFRRYRDAGYFFENYIHPTAIIGKSVSLGEGNNIFEGVIIQEGVSIGDANLIYAGAMIAHESEIGSFNSISVKACVAGCVEVKNNCFIGANATVRDHIILDDYTLVGAGTYADRSTEKYNVVVSSKSEILPGRKSTEFI